MRLRGAFFHEGHDHEDDEFFHDGEGGGKTPAGDGLEEGTDLTWALDNVELTTVGVDVGSSTSHLLFARLHLQRLTASLSSRFVVVQRDVLHRSPILLTPYRSDGAIDVDALEGFVRAAYTAAGLTSANVDTGAVILTGAALERANARAVADLFAGSGGKFVCASAGHNLEGILAAHGSGAAALSRQLGQTLLHVDVGGGTTKLALLRDGEIVCTAAIHVGGRLIAFDADDRVTRIEPSAITLADTLGVQLQLGARISENDRRRFADALVEILLDAIRGRSPSSDLARTFSLTEPLDMGALQPDGLTFSGGVAEYIYGREAARFGDLGPELAESLQCALRQHRLPAPPLPLGEGIRATVLGASQFSVQLSGSTVHISDAAILPLRNLPVVSARLASAHPDAAEVIRAIVTGFGRLDLTEGEQPVAIALPWRGEPHYDNLRALADGLVQALPRSLAAGFPLVIALDGDIGASLGGILHEDLQVMSPLLCIDGLQLVELDFVDIGELIQPAHVVPVVVKSLAFAPPPKEVSQHANGAHHANYAAT